MKTEEALLHKSTASLFFSWKHENLPLSSTPTIRFVDIFLCQRRQPSVDRELGSRSSHVNLRESLKFPVSLLQLGIFIWKLFHF